jgi:hypothetical protein
VRCGTRTLTELDPKGSGGCAQDPRGAQAAGHRYCKPAVQDGLALGLHDRPPARAATSSTRTFDASAQDKLLERCVALAKSFHTDRIRCFDYWRLDDQKPYRAAINAKLQRAAERCAKDNIILLLENEMSCNTATGEESAAVLAADP